jgi:hypothetical protein
MLTLTENNPHYYYALLKEEIEGINFFSFIRGLIDQSYSPMALALNPYRRPKRDTHRLEPIDQRGKETRHVRSDTLIPRPPQPRR